ncbi:hypothetical protein BGZ46_001362 [Entomortierella lignicola]|nr:hypothetical protein BGZ46_001362 [Entomortierella lignicola]KAF9200741.1 hypothetical protein BGZ49_009017 [Haplosporangium sp. Z 27]
MFTFRRDPQRNMAYVCPCGSQQACIDGLKIHVRGSVNRSMKRKGCPTIAELAKKIKKSKKCLYEDKNEDLPFNGEPSDSINEEGEEDLEKERKISTITAISNHTQQRRNHNNHNHRNNNHHNLIDMTTTINDILPLEDSDSYDFDIDSQYILDDCENNQALQDALDRLNKAQVELRRAQTELQRAQVVLQKAQVDIRNLCKGRISK